MKIVYRTPVQVFRKWIKELRSGNYEQAQGQLRECEYDFNKKTQEHEVVEVRGFCCLGVLCDIAAKDGGMQWGEIAKGMSLQDDDAEPPKVMLNYLGLTPDMVAHLIEMNDDEGATFEEIADEIEFNFMPALGLK